MPGDNEKGDGKTEKPSKLEILLGLAVVAAQVWFLLIPEHQRKLILLKVTETVRSQSQRFARRIGEREMRAELRGERPAYETSYWLSCLRDRAGALYDRLRTP